MRRILIPTGVVLTFSLLVASAALCARPLIVEAQEEEAPIVKAYLFSSNTCPSCRQLRENVIPSLYKRFGQSLRIRAIEISSAEENYRWLLACEEVYGVSEQEAGVPILFIGDRYLVGADIAAQLPDLVQEHLDNGGVGFPDVLPPEGTPEPTVRFAFFFSPTCPHCRHVEEDVFSQIKDKYGGQVEWDAYDTSEEENFRALVMLGRLAGLSEDSLGAVPVTFIGDERSMYGIFLGSVQAETFLEPAIEWFLDIGGVELPGWWPQLFEPIDLPSPQPTTEVPSPTVEMTPTPTATPPAEEAAIHVAYFVEAGCADCGRVSNLLQVMKRQYPNLVVDEFDVIEHAGLNVCLSEKLGVPEDQRLDAPAIFVGSDYLVDKDIKIDPLKEILQEYAQTGAEPIWESCDERQGNVPPPPPWWAVIVPGLIDGINPCAFATIVFFVSYLSLIERKGRDILIVGLSFALAIFLSYLGFGLVLREVFEGLIASVGSVLRVVLNVLVAVGCLVLAVLSLADFGKARQGKVTDMALRLPDKLRRWINATVRKGMRSQALDRLVVASFVTGVAVSFIELTCTGQVYVPIILGLSNPGYQWQAMLSLVVYCLAFIVPLIVVFLVSYFGTSSRQLGQLLQRHTATVKLATAMLFLVMGAGLIYETIRLWGILPLS
jgi:cytochrome c biogenesis protein CcdA/thiol-disulfide isomerase/thioredoxin